jgi:hypothetical protein
MRLLGIAFRSYFLVSAYSFAKPRRPRFHSGLKSARGARPSLRRVAHARGGVADGGVDMGLELLEVLGEHVDEALGLGVEG